MNQFINQPVVNWAKQNLQKNVRVEPRFNSLFSKIFVGFGYSILGVSLLWLPCMFLYGAIRNFITKGWSEMVTGGLLGSGILFLILGRLFVAVIYLPLRTRRKIVKLLSADSVETRGGQQYRWENLYFLNYKKVSTRVRGNLTATAAQSAVLAGAEKITVEMTFANGTVIVPPLINNQPKILGLLETMPVQRRDEGTTRQN